MPGSEFEQAADVRLIAHGFDPVPFPPGSDLAHDLVTGYAALATVVQPAQIEPVGLSNP